MQGRGKPGLDSEGAKLPNSEFALGEFDPKLTSPHCAGYIACATNGADAREYYVT